MSAPNTSSGLTDAQYSDAVQAVLTRIETTVDRWLESDVTDIDSARSGGMLTLTLPNRTQLIINAQPPLQELWLAARRGGFHFRHAPDGRWLDTRSGDEFFALLSACASEQAGAPLSF
ncbi:iron donor protein CyaY [Aquabacterium sp. CECT 9606]|jgi:CyaY protein|uniref:iron donor protein CyaY n=1 Tax=Aquabacterium sp. CECT 9606 TaxID=2845822 RepID=UPI001E4EE007|nr:iron donor protein CyaY [Aquabacterium sp. CECT 9606]CAH0354495.1 Iron-sulfur cluster assembly protein CyaY [Aquabacterium sp. CECT 9606]